MDGIIDLHVHSNYSDGKRSLDFLNQKVIENNIKVISLTEHYNLSSYRAFKAKVNNDVEVIPGIELSASLLNYGLSKRHVCHIVAYYPSTQIYSILDEYEISRKKCIDQTIELLKKEGIDISFTKVKRVARDPESVGRFDIAIALCNLGYSRTPAKAYSQFFDVNSKVYIDREKMEVGTLIKNILTCGGVPVLAHPKTLRLNESDLISFISELKSFGLCGIEAYNPHNSLELRNMFLGICDDFEFIPTVGTDYHGRKGENVEIGLGIDNNLSISDYSIIQNLKNKKKQLFY